MPDLILQIADLNNQINALQQQRADLEQQLAEDPQRQKSVVEVAAAVQDAPAWGGLGVTVLPADQGAQIHPDWVYVALPAKGAWDEVQALRERLLAVGGEPGGKPGQIYIHREKAVAEIAP